MVGNRYFAVVYVYVDGEEQAYIPCLREDQVMAAASRYDKVRVIRDGLPPFWLRLTEAERAKYALPVVEDFEPDLLYEPSTECVNTAGEFRADTKKATDLHPGELYDSWNAYKSKERYYSRYYGD